MQYIFILSLSCVLQLAIFRKSKTLSISLQFHISASNKSFGFEYQDIFSLVLSRQQLLTITSVELEMYCLRAITAISEADACFLLSFEI